MGTSRPEDRGRKRKTNEVEGKYLRNPGGMVLTNGATNGRASAICLIRLFEYLGGDPRTLGLSNSERIHPDDYAR